MPPAARGVTAGWNGAVRMRVAMPGSGIRADAAMIVRLGAPLLVNNLALAAMGFADTVMAGVLGPVALAAVAVGVSYTSIFLNAGLGLTMALSPVVAHAYGAGDGRRLADVAQQGLWIALAAAVPLVAAQFAVRRVLVGVGTDPAVIPAATGYVWAMAAGIPGLLAFEWLRFASEGIGRTRPMMYVGFVGLLVNVAANWVFMFGKLGMPALGAVGTGVGTAICSWTMFLAMAWYVRRQPAYAATGLMRRFVLPRWAVLREVLSLGVPIAGSLVAENGLIATAGILIGTLGSAAVAAHQIAFSYATLMFMAPLALHSATTIHVGHALGRGDRAGGRRAGIVGIALCGLFMGCSALLILCFSREITFVYTRDPAVRDAAAQLLLVAALLQVSDGLQVGASGALRGFRDARVPLLLCVGSYWLVGFPLALWGGVIRHGGPVAVWHGLIAGLSVAALLLCARFLRISARSPALQ